MEGGGDDDDTDDDDDDTVKSEGDSTVGGENSEDDDNVPKATTDTASADALDELRDKNAEERLYANIPKIDMDKHIVDYKTCIKEFYGKYAENSEDCYFSQTLEKLEELKKDSKNCIKIWRQIMVFKTKIFI